MSCNTHLSRGMHIPCSYLYLQRVAIRTINKTFEGVAIDIDDHGALIIRKDNGRIERVIAGDCFQL